MSDSELHMAAIEVRILTAIITKEARHELEQRFKAHGSMVSALQYRVLILLQHAPYTLKELSRQLMVEPATLVPVIDALERHDLLRRGHDPHDRRRTPLALTAQGIAQLDRIPFADEQDQIAGYLRGLDADERATFVKHLRGLTTHLLGDDHVVRQIAASLQRHMDFEMSQQRIPDSQQPTTEEAPS